MKKVVVVTLIINVGLILYALWIFNKNDYQKMERLVDVSNMQLSDALEVLSDKKIIISYVESSKPCDVIVSSVPKANTLLSKNDTITLLVSLGEKEKYQNLVNQDYALASEYLQQLVDEYNIRIVINYVEDDLLPEGLIVEFQTSSQYLTENDVIELSVVKNPRAIIIPDFSGWYYKEVSQFCQEHDIQVIYIYVDSEMFSDCVVSQSVKAGSYVLKKTGYIEVYLAK